MRSWMITIVILAGLLTSGGCLEGLLRSPSAVVTAEVRTLTEKVDTYQELVKDIVDQMEEDELVTEEMADKLDAAYIKIDEVQPKVIAVAEAMAESDTILGGLVAANEASSPFNPYYPYIALALGIAEVVTVGAAKKRGEAAKRAAKDSEYWEKTFVKASDELDTAEKEARKYKAMKAATEKFRIDNPDKAAELYADVGEARKAVGV